LIVRVKDEAAKKTSGKQVDDLVRNLLESGEYPVYLRDRLPTLGEVRGRIVLLCDWAGGQFGIQWGGKSMSIQDEWWQTSATRKWEITRERLDTAVPSPSVLQVHFTSASGLPKKTPETMARSVNTSLSQYLHGICSRYLGVIVMDFPSAHLCELIVHRNQHSLDPRRSSTHLKACSQKTHEWLDVLSTELTASAARADAAVEAAVAEAVHSESGEGRSRCGTWPPPGHPEDIHAKAKWLAHIYIELAFERASAELREPAMEVPDGHVPLESTAEAWLPGAGATKKSKAVKDFVHQGSSLPISGGWIVVT